MTPGLTITIVDADYLGIEIFASTNHFSGSVRIYGRADKLSTFTSKIAGFPKDRQDQRTHEFGSLSTRVAGGFCSLGFRVLDPAGHVALDIALEDDDDWGPPASARMTLHVEAAGIDRFVAALETIERERQGTATLPSVR